MKIKLFIICLIISLPVYAEEIPKNLEQSLKQDEVELSQEIKLQEQIEKTEKELEKKRKEMELQRLKQQIERIEKEKRKYMTSQEEVSEPSVTEVPVIRTTSDNKPESAEQVPTATFRLQETLSVDGISFCRIIINGLPEQFKEGTTILGGFTIKEIGKDNITIAKKDKKIQLFLNQPVAIELSERKKQIEIKPPKPNIQTKTDIQTNRQEAPKPKKETTKQKNKIQVKTIEKPQNTNEKQKTTEQKKPDNKAPEHDKNHDKNKEESLQDIIKNESL